MTREAFFLTGSMKRTKRNHKCLIPTGKILREISLKNKTLYSSGIYFKHTVDRVIRTRRTIFLLANGNNHILTWSDIFPSLIGSRYHLLHIAGLPLARRLPGAHNGHQVEAAVAAVGFSSSALYAVEFTLVLASHAAQGAKIISAHVFRQAVLDGWKTIEG